LKPIRYTRHARSRVQQHHIDETGVISALESPEQLLPSVKSRYNALKKIGTGIIRVTFIEETDHSLVITVSPRKCFQEEKQDENRR
jgi:hypothetical protein